MKFSLEHCLLRIFEWVRLGFGKPNTLVWALATFQEISTRERTRFLSSLCLSLSQKNWNMNSPFCTSIWYFLNWWQKNLIYNMLFMWKYNCNPLKKLLYKPTSYKAFFIYSQNFLQVNIIILFLETEGNWGKKQRSILLRITQLAIS